MFEYSFPAPVAPHFAKVETPKGSDIWLVNTEYNTTAAMSFLHEFSGRKLTPRFLIKNGKNSKPGYNRQDVVKNILRVKYDGKEVAIVWSQMPLNEYASVDVDFPFPVTGDGDVLIAIEVHVVSADSFTELASFTLDQGFNVNMVIPGSVIPRIPRSLRYPPANSGKFTASLLC